MDVNSLAFPSKSKSNSKFLLSLAELGNILHGAGLQPVQYRLHFVPFALLPGSNKIAFDLGRTPRSHALHVPLVPGQLRDGLIFRALEVLIGRGWDRSRLSLMGNRLLLLRGNRLRLCRVRFLEEVEWIDCLWLRLVSLGDDSRGVVAGISVGQVFQSALRTRARADRVVQKIQKVHFFSFLLG